MTCSHALSESPYPKHPDLFGSFPSAAAGEKYVSIVGFFAAVLIIQRCYRRRKPFDSPSAPVRAADYKLLMDFDIA